MNYLIPLPSCSYSLEVIQLIYAFTSHDIYFCKGKNYKNVVKLFDNSTFWKFIMISKSIKTDAQVM